MDIFLQGLIAIIAIMSAFWLIRKMLRPKSPAEPAEESFADVHAPKKSNPKGRAGAVALAEPDDDDPADTYPPPML